MSMNYNYYKQSYNFRSVLIIILIVFIFKNAISLKVNLSIQIIKDHIICIILPYGNLYFKVQFYLIPFQITTDIIINYSYEFCQLLQYFKFMLYFSLHLVPLFIFYSNDLQFYWSKLHLEYHSHSF